MEDPLNRIVFNTVLDAISTGSEMKYLGCYVFDHPVYLGSSLMTLQRAQSFVSYGSMSKHDNNTLDHPRPAEILPKVPQIAQPRD